MINLMRSKRSKRALVVELNPFHGHTLYSQCIFLLGAGYEVTLLIVENQPEKELLLSLKDRVKIVMQRPGKYSLFLAFCRTLLHRYDFVVFNTIVSSTQMILALLQRHEVRFVAHNFGENIDQSRIKIILYHLLLRRAKRIYVLSEKVYTYCVDTAPPHIKGKLTYFHPAFFPGFTSENLTPEQTANEPIVFAVPGNIVSNRRNYESLWNVLSRIHESALRGRIDIRILGDFNTSEGRDFVLRAGEYGYLGPIIHFQHSPFLPFPRFAEQLNNSHFLLPLVDHTILQEMKYRYFNQKTPSSFMLSRGFCIPLVCSSDLDFDDDLKPFTITHPGDDLFSGILAAVDLFDRGGYPELKKRYQQHMADIYTVSKTNYLAVAR